MSRCTTALLAALLAVAGSGDEVVRVENPHYVAVVDRARGGLITTLAARKTGETLVDGMRIYTDSGVLADGRYGYVGTGEGTCREFSVRRDGPVTVVEASGKLGGAPAGRLPAMYYRCRTRFDSGPTIFVAASVKPTVTREVQGFLAVAWHMPAMARWAVRTIEGMLRHVYEPGEGKRGRSYSRQWPLDPVRPLLEFITARGATVKVENIRSTGRPAFTGPVIHGQSVFLCWADGPPRKIVASKWATLEFTLTVGQMPAAAGAATAGPTRPGG